ncbi:DUF4962 domain-containing protein [Luteolibacter ambystomatis]|uniref:DUF4962 domain-containing protein n=1 Tax=Luteolibacter ambystomatis TaxID=2824561 RepID=A0A975J0V4_9BACT|nr:DUF4962 domain-containing protein [Luteolibacter ambystomatis]QUE51929.1 DUF4962 domain-containing protein [Luteolibacter ambystomatis]
MQHTLAFVAGFLVLSGNMAPIWAAPRLPSALYEEWRVSPFPSGGSVSINPPALQWASVKHWEKKDASYTVEISKESSFPANATMKSSEQIWCFFNPHRKLAPGTWFWRYTIKSGGASTVKGPFTFQVGERTPVFDSADFQDFAANIPRRHPFAVTEGVSLAAVRKNAASHPLAATIIERGKKIAAAAIYSGPVSDRDPAKDREVSGLASKEAGALTSLVDAYLLCGDPAMKEGILKRIDVVSGWPTDDLLGSGVLTSLSRAYDGMHAELPEGVRTKILAVIDRQLKSKLSAWPGNIEGRQVENHFWQAELAANFCAGVATFHELESSRKMVEYTYELFLARFPNLATQDGGWSEGLGYFGVNKTAVVDMARLMKAVGGVNPFEMPWYQNLADYFIYFAPIGGRIDGFGDMHDRVGNGGIGTSMIFTVAKESGEPKAVFWSSKLMKGKQDVEPWYQIIHGIRPDSSVVPAPANLPGMKVFEGVGLAAMHTNVLDAPHDTAVYFRSSPFGAKGHMHANQNAFNLSRKGEPLFYSTGYYTTFADPHSMSSYRHTRAHNTILINGHGQAFGHEGYGWIKRQLQGRKISYVCGDATMAYRKTTDSQFIGMMKSSDMDPEKEEGDAKLKLFERHMVFVRPDTLVVYDVLDSEKENEWALLLHAPMAPTLDQGGQVTLDTGSSLVRAAVAGSGPLKYGLTDQFHSPPVDIKKKYGKMPNQYHLNYTSAGKSSKMRFLTVVRMADSGKSLSPVAIPANGNVEVSGVRIDAELDTSKAPSLSISGEGATLKVNAWPAELDGRAVATPTGHGTLLLENGTTTVSEDSLPPGLSTAP